MTSTLSWNQTLHQTRGDSVAKTPTTLTRITGVGPVIAGCLLGRVGDPRRFPTGGHSASYAGAASVEVSSGDTRRHRPSRAGDRQLNAALHMIAIVQIRITDSERARLLPPQTHRRPDQEGSPSMPETTPRRSRLEKHDPRPSRRRHTPHRHGLTERRPRIMHNRGNKSCQA